MPTNPNNEANRKPMKRREQKELEKRNDKSTADKDHTAEHQQDKSKKKSRKRKRIFPIWLRIIIVLILCVAALLGGLMIGYGIIGSGNARDALELDTWKHILEIVGI